MRYTNPRLLYFTLCDQIGLSCHCVCLCAASRKKLCVYLHEIFTKDMSWRSLKTQNDFISDVIRIDLHCHLEVTWAQQGHFGIKLTVAQIR